MTQLKGIDVSHWQQGLDLAKTDAQFVIVKATQGTTMVDSQCDNFIQQAKKLGKPYGVYHFAERGGTAEADYFVKNVQGYIGDAILALDWEADAVKNGPSAAKAFLDRVYAKTGVKPVIYTNTSVLNSYDWSAVAKADYGLWIARWASGPGDISPWKAWTLWQFTDHHSTGGMAVDGDYFNGDKATWKAYASGSGSKSNGSDTADEADTTGDDDMEHFVRWRTTDQPLPDDGQWHTIKVREDKEANEKQIVSGPADVISAVAYISASGLGDEMYLDVRAYAVDDPSGGGNEEVTSTSPYTRHFTEGGSVHAAFPFNWDLGKASAKDTVRRLRLEVRVSGKSKDAKIDGVRVEGWMRK